jgi:hypothetical protein
MNDPTTPSAGTGRQVLAQSPGVDDAGRLEVVVGPGSGGVAVAIDLGAGPVLVAGPAGSGRTTTARLLAAQALRAGATCSIIDHRRGHARWVNGGVGRPSVVLWPSAGETRDGLASLARLCEQRHALADRYQTDQPGGDHPHVLVVEDLHRLARELGPASGATRALEALIYGGRGAGLAIIATTGLHRSASSLRPSLAEQFPTRITHHTGTGRCQCRCQCRGRGRVEVTDPAVGTRPARVIYLTGPGANAWAVGGDAEVVLGNYIGCPACGERCPTADPVAGRPHRCVDHLDHIGGWPPYECLVCGKRLSHLDIEGVGQP